jgi:hypothetical protein
MRNKLTAAAGLACAAVLMASPALSSTSEAPGTGRLAPCQYEDSNGCVWDAQHSGNGFGRSFVVTPAGKLIPVPHYVAHALVFGAKAGS